MKMVYSYAFLDLLLGVKWDILVFFSLSATYLSSLSLLILIYYALFAKLYSGSSSMTSSMECWGSEQFDFSSSWMTISWF